jgi:hypothetical protein
MLGVVVGGRWRLDDRSVRLLPTECVVMEEDTRTNKSINKREVSTTANKNNDGSFKTRCDEAMLKADKPHDKV